MSKDDNDGQSEEIERKLADELLELAAHAEGFSDHPISQSIRRAYGREIDRSKVSEVYEIAGHGIEAMVSGRKIIAGNDKLMKLKGIEHADHGLIGTVVHVAVDGEYAGYILISDKVKEDSARAVKELRDLGIKNLIMLTGDNKKTGETIAEDLKLDRVYAELLPADKVDKLEEIMSGCRVMISWYMPVTV